MDKQREQRLKFVEDCQTDFFIRKMARQGIIGGVCVLLAIIVMSNI